MISILIVEDEFLTADFIKDTLLEIGYVVSGIATNADECLDILEKEKTDLVFLDINIDGDMDGIQLAHKIRKEYNIPYIFLTSYLDKRTVDLALAAKPSSYITKPFNKIALYTSIEVALKNYSLGIAATSAKDTTIMHETTFFSKEFLFVKDKGAYMKIVAKNVMYFQSELKYIDIYTINKRYTIRYSLPDLLLKLGKNNFVQCHRSYAVNINKIMRIDPNTILLDDKRNIPLSRSYKEDVMSRLNLL